MPEYGTFDLHVHFVKRIHDSFDPVFVDLHEEVLDGLLGGGAGGIRRDGGRGARGTRAGAGEGGLVKEEEFDIGAGDEAGNIVVEELVDHFEVPIDERGGNPLALLLNSTTE